MSKPKVIWNKENTIKLIEQYESYPELWNCALKEYRDRDKKSQSLKIISEVLEIEEAEITRKWHNLRCQMNSEIRKIKKKKSGDGTDDNYKSSWEFYNSLLFIAGYHDYNQSTGTMSVPGELSRDVPNLKRSLNDENELSEEEIAASTTSNAVTKPIKKNYKSTKRTDRKEEAALEQALAVLNKPADDNSVFGEFVAAELRQLQSEEKRKKLKRIIQKAIINIGEEEELERSQLNKKLYTSPPLPQLWYSKSSSDNASENEIITIHEFTH